MREGIWRLYRMYPNEKGESQRRLVARFVLYGDTLSALEDHDDIIESLAPNGHLDGRGLARLESMANSPYWNTVHEDDVQSGEHSGLLPEVQEAGPDAWPKQEE